MISHRGERGLDYTHSWKNKTNIDMVQCWCACMLLAPIKIWYLYGWQALVPSRFILISILCACICLLVCPALRHKVRFSLCWREFKNSIGKNSTRLGYAWRRGLWGSDCRSISEYEFGGKCERERIKSKGRWLAGTKIRVGRREKTESFIDRQFVLASDLWPFSQRQQRLN